MMKIKARYFYSPICPESFSSIDKLKDLFQSFDEIDFEHFNTIKDDIVSDIPWYPAEREIINTLEGISSEGMSKKPLFLGKLFINGEEVKGFPPSPKSIKEILGRYKILLDSKLYTLNYIKENREKLECNKDNLQHQKYSDKITMDTCRLCTEFHPYIPVGSYQRENWLKYEEQKYAFIQEKHNEGKMSGVITYHKGIPVGFIEAFSLDTAVKLGFPVSKQNSNGLMITCLSVRTEYSGYGVAGELVKRLEEEAIENSYATVEVIAFPDSHNWQPEALYEKAGYHEVGRVSGLKLLKKNLL